MYIAIYVYTETFILSCYQTMKYATPLHNTQEDVPRPNGRGREREREKKRERERDREREREREKERECENERQRERERGRKRVSERRERGEGGGGERKGLQSLQKVRIQLKYPDEREDSST